MRVLHGPQSRFRLPGAAAVTAALAAVTAVLGAVTAALPGAVLPASAATGAFAGQASLAADSCRGASWCMAVGSYTTTDHVQHSLAAIFNGSSWRSLKNPPGKHLDAVACSSKTFCMAQGGPTGAERWNGTTWRTMPGPKGGLASLTCASRTLCMRIHGTLVSVWNGTSWHDVGATAFCGGGPDGPCGLAGVSCASTSDCLAVGTVTVSQEPVQDAIAFAWNGKAWSREIEAPAPGNPADLNTVSCISAYCMTAGVASSDVAGASIAFGDEFHPTGQTWTDATPDLGGICPEFQSCAWAGIVACGSSTSCITIPGMRSSQFWDGTSWRPSKAVSAGRGSGLQDVSCGGSNCLAVGWQTSHGLRRTLAELWNGSAWTIVKTPKGR